MEQHKVLIVVVSVTLAFAAVVGIGMAYFYPRATDDSLSVTHDSSIDPRRSFDPIEFIRSPETATDSVELLPEEPRGADDDVIIIYGVDDTLSQPKNGRQPRVTEDTRPSVPADPAPTATKPAPREPASQPDQQGEPQRAAPARPAEEAAPAEPAQQRVRVTEYWIQVISSPSRDRVEQARVRLQQQNLGSRITSIDHNNTTFFRLRVGPYTNKAEADKFLDWVQAVDGFEESYISEEYPMRTVSG
ncbi:MAG: SPOR domain-containing protein [Spirochaeta sp.]|nr:SPOR domain-containing protein [Spirochaeta sp.]